MISLPRPQPMSLLGYVVLITAVVAPDCVAQVEVTIEGGVHAARLDRPERALEEPARGVSLQGAAGEATTFGLRLNGPIRGRLYLDGGVAWSRNTSAQGSVGPGMPRFEIHTVFTSATVQARLTAPDARLDLRAGAGPALILHGGTGASLLARQADLGALLAIGTGFSLDGRLGLRVDAHEYLFSSQFTDAYTPAWIGAPTQPAGARFRHEFALLVGISWRTH
jgi:hypothetical protein